jgi:hypothetical protein
VPADGHGTQPLAAAPCERSDGPELAAGAGIPAAKKKSTTRTTISSGVIEYMMRINSHFPSPGPLWLPVLRNDAI